MDSLTLNEIAGEHLVLYERYFQEANPSNSPFLNALEAATFLRKSGLTQLILKNIWDLSDPECLGHLDKKAFFISLKLIAMAQNGKELSVNNLKTPLPPPSIGDNLVWRILPENVQKYTALFNSMKPNDGKLSGAQVKPYMMNSKLQVEILTRIWDLSDIDQDGSLNLKEFILSCHLISKASQGFQIPPVLPPDLLNFDPSVPRQTAVPTLNWIVSNEDKVKCDEEFLKLDKDADGFVTGIDVKDTLLQSGLPQNVLAHIWNLCDIKGNGKLNAEQFALATYFIKQKQDGKELPLQLAPNMVPPTLRPKPTESTSNENLNGVAAKPASTGNKELDSLTEEIKQLQLDKVKYESEVTAEEASLRLKQSEIKNLQNEIENLSQMLKQLENQKNDATRRLDDLNAQISLLETDLHEIKAKFSVESEKVENLNRQYQEQKKSIEEQEVDLVSKRKEFENLKLEEAQLEKKLSSTKGDVDQVSEIATKTQLEISQAKANFVELEEYERRSNEMLDDFDNAIASVDYAKIASLLPRTITPPPFLDEESQTIDDFNVSKAEFTADPFAGEDPFKDDPFDTKGTDSENFANFDAFGASFPTNKNDPFGFSPFESDSTQGSAYRSESPTPALPPKKSKAPPPRPAPPKSTNKTPMRAAPPPPHKDIAISSNNTNSTFNNSNFDPFNDNRDPFNSGSFATQSFANFADFDKA